MEESKLDILKDYHVLKVLGQGGEGTVYLVQDKERFSELLLKVFHEPHTPDCLPGLVLYAERVKTNDFGLPAIKILYDGDQIIGAIYPYTPLRSIHWRILNSSEKIAQSIIGSYSQMQYYLMTNHGLALYDPPLPNLMVDRDGKWHYSDIGGGICALDDPYVFKRGLMGYGFASLFLSVYNETLYKWVTAMEGYSHNEPCIYCKNERLVEMAEKHSWVKDIFCDVWTNNSSIFYAQGFYRNIYKELPNRIPWPSLVLAVNFALTGLCKFRKPLGL